MSASAEDPLLEAAARISKGERVDWDAIRNQIGSPEQAAVAEELKALERLAQVSLSVPSAWGRFVIIEQLGRGTFGAVYRAVDPNLQFEVALKVIRSRRADTPADDEQALEEARRLVRIRHPNVVRVYGVERIGRDVGLSMELVKGRTLEDIVRSQAPFGTSEAVIIGLDLCRALAGVHAAGMLHGDIKAQNVMREDGGRIVLMDFGTSRDLNRPPAGADFAGTPLYLAPEVFAGEHRTPSSDIYSLGVLLYFLVTGTYPVEGDSRTDIGRQHHVRWPRRPLRDVRSDLSDAFIYVVERATAERPDDRFESAGAFEAALAHVLTPIALEHRHSAAPPRPTGSGRPQPRWSRRTRGALSFSALLILATGVATVQYRFGPHHVGADSPSAVTARAQGAGTAPAAPAAGAFRVDAAFYRERPGNIELLNPGAAVALHDSLSLQLEVSVPAYVYVINEDEKGESFLVFPFAGQALPTPLPPGQRHRLPGVVGGEQKSWQISSVGEKEHFLVVASPERSPTLEGLFAALSRPTLGPAPINARDPLAVLRGAAILAPSPAQHKQPLKDRPEFSTPFTPGKEVANGVWIRHATFDNRVPPS